MRPVINQNTKNKSVILNTGEWQGSEATADYVRQQIEERWGEEAAAKYHPLKNCFTYKTWQQKGYQVRRDEKPIKSITVLRIAPKDKNDKPVKDPEQVKTVKKSVNLFYINQVEPIKN